MLFRSAGFDGEDLTGDIAAARITDALNATGSAPLYACRAWVNFNGTGTVAMRASGNVSSITDNGTGDYTVNFTTAMSDANYAVTSSGDRSNAATSNAYMSAIQNQGAASFDLICSASAANSRTNHVSVQLVVFR